MTILTREQVIEIANRFTKEMGTKEFIDRFSTYIQGHGPMDPDKLFDELEGLQKFLYAEWDIHPDVGPDDMLEQLHKAATVYKDSETHQALDFMCSRIQIVLNVVGNAHSGPGDNNSGGGAGAHGHSHNGQPCHGHGHHGGQPMMPNPMQMQMMQLAVQMALNDEERAYMAESQKLVMEGKMNQIDDARKQRMTALQGRLIGWMQSTAPLVKEQMDTAYQTILTQEERDYAEATQKMIMTGAARPDEERLKKIDALQAKVLAYVQTMLTFLTAAGSQSAAAATATTSTTTSK